MISILLNIPMNSEDKNPKIIIGKNILDKLFCKYLLEPRKIEASNAPIPADAVINDKLVLLPDKISPAMVGWISKTPLTNNALMKMFKQQGVKPLPEESEESVEKTTEKLVERNMLGRLAKQLKLNEEGKQKMFAYFEKGELNQ